MSTDTVLYARLPLPPVELSPNARLYWRAKARAVKVYRTHCAAVLMLAKHAFWLPGPVEIDVEYRTYRAAKRYHPKDEDNARASLKSAGDALRDAGVIQSDAREHVRWGKFQLFTRERESPMGAGVWITVRRV